METTPTPELAPEKKAEMDWLDSILDQTKAKAKELSELFGCEVEAVAYVVESMKDAAVGYLRRPDAEQGFKLVRMLLESEPTAASFAVRSLLIRDTDLLAKGLEGKASDPRFMDVNGNYDKMHSELNTSILIKGLRMCSFYSNQFKKK